MSIKPVLRHFLTALLLCSCNPLGGEKAKVTFFKASAFKDLKASVSSVSIQNHQLIITGSGLSKITSATLKNADQTATFQVEGASDSRLTTNALKNITLIAGSVFDLILSDAYGAATFQVSFTVPDGSVGASKLSSMGASAGQILKYNGTSWAPATQIDAQTFLGTWNASNNSGGVPDLNSLLLNPGDYYVVSDAGTFNGVAYAVGDWIISDGYGWQKIPYSKTAVTSFQGRKGIVTLGPSDYVSLKDVITQKITGSSISDLADIDFATAPLNGQVLKYNSTTLKWAPANDNAAASGIAMTDLSASAPLAYNNTTGVFSLPAANVLALPLTSLASGTGAITASDSILGAFGKLMSLPNDYVSRSSGASIVTGTIAVSGTGMITVPTATGTTLTEVANVTYVNNMIAANGVWSKSGSDINYNSGKVGIGTATPAERLHVSGGNFRNEGTFRTGVSGEPGRWRFYDSSGYLMSFWIPGTDYDDWGLYWDTAVNKLIWRGSGADRASIDLNNGSGYFQGNVGIGTTNPTTALHVVGGSIYSQNDANSGSAIAALTAGAADANGGHAGIGVNAIANAVDYGYGMSRIDLTKSGWLLAGRNANAANEANDFFALKYTNVAGVTSEYFRVLGNGNVGVGTASPLRLLDVNGTSFGLTSVGGQTRAIMGNRDSAAIPGIIASENGNLRFGKGSSFGAADGGTLTEAMTILSSGNVGIGTTSPASKLDVYGTTTFSNDAYGYLSITPTGGDGGSAVIKQSTNPPRNGGDLTIQVDSSVQGGNFIIATGGSTERMRVNSNGNVGIGTITPSEKLEVAGSIKATEFLYSSDRSLKKNIMNIDDSLEKILALRGVEFDWKKTGVHEIGLIAQEVEEVETSLVVTSAVDGLKSVKYGNVVALIIEAMKVEHQKVEDNKKRFLVMSRGVEKIDQRVGKLEREIASLNEVNLALQKKNLEMSERLSKLEKIILKRHK